MTGTGPVRKLAAAAAVVAWAWVLGACIGRAPERKEPKIDLTGTVRTHDRLVRGDGIAFVLESTPTSVRLRRVAATSRENTDESADARIGSPDWFERPPIDELIVTLHDARGEELSRYGFRLDRTGFHDRVDRAGGLEGMPTWDKQATQMIRVPFLPDASFVHFRRATTSIVPPGPGLATIDPGHLRLKVCLTETRDDGSSAVLRTEDLGSFELSTVAEGTDVAAPLSLPGCFPPHAYGPQIRWKDDKPAFGWHGGPSKVPEADPAAIHALAASMPSCPSVLNDPATAFNVVFLAEGFEVDEADAFKDEARDAFDALMARRPFSLFPSKTNCYQVFGASSESGVDHCPAQITPCPSDGTTCGGCTSCCPSPGPDPKDTFLEVHGIADGLGSCTNFAADDDLAILDAAATVIDPALVDLFVVLVNCGLTDGKAHASLPIVFVARKHLDRPGLLAHEVAHALSTHPLTDDIGEEYISFAVPAEPAVSGVCTAGCRDVDGWANIAPIDGTGAAAFPWFRFAQAGEWPGGVPPASRVVTHHKACTEDPAVGCDDDSDCDGLGACTLVGYGPRAQPGSGDANEWQDLGAYWGAQWVRDDCQPNGAVIPVACCDAPLPLRRATPPCYNLQGALTANGRYWSDQGRHFARPMPYCTMRDVKEPFCRVCACTLWEVLAAATDTPPGARPEACGPTGTLHVRLTVGPADPDPDPVLGTVRIDGPRGSPMYSTRWESTDDAGRARFSVVPGGVYLVSTAPPGYATHVEPVVVVPGESTSIEIAY